MEKILSDGAGEDTVCACTGRKKERSPEEVAKYTSRLSKIEGQIRAIKRMMEQSAYCADIICQLRAASAALNSLVKELLAEHLNSCVVDDIRAEREGAIEELQALLWPLLK